MNYIAAEKPAPLAGCKQFHIPLPLQANLRPPESRRKPLRCFQMDPRIRKHQEYEFFRKTQTTQRKQLDFQQTYIFFKAVSDEPCPQSEQDYLFVEPISIGRQIAKKLQMLQTTKNKPSRSVLIRTGPFTPKHSNSVSGKSRSSNAPLGFCLTQKEPDFFDYLFKLRDLAWKVNFSNQLKVAPVKECLRPQLKAFVGRGNNSNLIKSLLRRRWWWQVVQSYAPQVNFVWTQIKIDSYYKAQCSIDWKAIQTERYPACEGDILNENERILLNKIGRKKTNTMGGNQAFPNRAALTVNHCSIRPEYVQNHLRQNYVIGNKKALFYTLKAHAERSNLRLADWIPLTFHVRKGTEDQQYGKFIAAYYKLERERKSLGCKRPSVWILKPGESTNRGRGITVHSKAQSIKRTVKCREKHEDGSDKTYIIQKYIERPLLYCRRKFDIRHYILLTSVNGIVKGYWYQQGYIRTSSSYFDLSTSDPLTHLTNDAVQKYAQDYGKFQRANKLSYEEFNKYLHKSNSPCDFFKDIIPKLVDITRHVMQACGRQVDSGKLHCNFQLFGLDFMIDEAYKPYLIECNSNPCLQLCCPLLAKLIPELVDNVFRLTLDAWFPPPCEWPQAKRLLLKDRENRFSLIYDSRGNQGEQVDSQVLKEVGAMDDDDVFEDDGSDLQF